MAYQHTTYTGTTGTFQYSIGFDYVRTTDIVVLVDGSPDTDFAFANSGKDIVWVTPLEPQTGESISIQRVTPVPDLPVVFTNGAGLPEANLNDDFDAVMFAEDEERFAQGNLDTVQRTDIDANTAQVATNVTNIATNVTNISSNDTDIATNVTNIATNTAGVATNVTNIATNVSNISSNDTDIATNVTDIATNTSGVATNVTNIATNATNIATNVTDIATLESEHPDQVLDSTGQAPSAAQVINHGATAGGVTPDYYHATLTCTSAELGYDVGDFVPLASIIGMSIYFDTSSNLVIAHGQVTIGTQVLSRVTGAPASIDQNKWDLRIVAYTEDDW